eukprot:542514_1
MDNESDDNDCIQEQFEKMANFIIQKAIDYPYIEDRKHNPKYQLNVNDMNEYDDYRERERPKQKTRFKLKYRDGTPCCIECGRNNINGYFNNNNIKNSHKKNRNINRKDNETDIEIEEDLFWCYECIKYSRECDYKDAMRSKSFCDKMNECPQQVKQTINMDDNGNVKIIRKHILLSDMPSGIGYVKGKINDNGVFWCEMCWRNYRECWDLIPYDYTQSIFVSDVDI